MSLYLRHRRTTLHTDVDENDKDDTTRTAIAKNDDGTKVMTTNRILTAVILTVIGAFMFVILIHVGMVLGSSIHDWYMEQSDERISIRRYNDEHPVASLNCADHGGPTNKQIIDDMIYWQDIPSDSLYMSPLHPNDTEKFLSFEPDFAGWNNLR